MTRAQQTASDPSLSVWVAANAGTGKTKVLTDRVLRLLLQGASPSRILCITYTKAAAVEMQNRIHESLKKWVAMDDAALDEVLRILTDNKNDHTTRLRARRLFAEVLDAPEGVRIQTIHGLCQSILRRFPLEAGVEPHFSVIDERTAQELLAEARQRLFTRSISGEDAQLTASVEYLASCLNESQMHEVLYALVNERRNLLPLLHAEGGVTKLVQNVYQALEIMPDITDEAIFLQCFAYEPFQENALRAAMAAGVPNADKMQSWWEQSETLARMPYYAQYREVWLTGSNEPRKKLVNKSHADFTDIMVREQERILAYEERLKSIASAKMTEAVIHVTQALLALYTRFKLQRQALDYDDLILYTLRLLTQSNMAEWVMYKMDGGLSHVLIDEAQDTSPEQWQLVQALVGDFFAGESRHTIQPTLFVVGDEKQSIYSFQGAEPDRFLSMRDFFAGQAGHADIKFERVPLGLSFRSTEAVLKVVDEVFVQENAMHEAHRNGEAGRVELWPVLQKEKQEKEHVNAWEAALEASTLQKDSQQQLAEQITAQIQQWLQTGEMLEAKGRPIRAGDVLVLVRRRNAFMHHMVRSLKQAGVPVAGVDRMMLTETLPVQDLLALAEFLLLPEDDLSLACVLKSPLCGLGEEDLFTLAYNRHPATLWSRVWENDLASVTPVRALLKSLLDKADFIRPYELFSYVLEVQGGRKAFAARLGEEALEPLEEFLALTLDYEHEHIPTLQGFLHWFNSGDAEIKRDLEHGVNAVRIMTVHGSKGLQAPIVFLPDTIHVGSYPNSLLWGEVDGEKLLLYSSSKQSDPALAAAWRQKQTDAENREYRRLLYVAMTRAEDRLYVSGCLPANRKDVPEDSWYGVVRRAMQDIAVEEEGKLIVSCPQIKEVISRTTMTEQGSALPLPDYFRLPPAPEPYPPQPLAPSQHDEEVLANAGAAPSPVSESMRFRRGTLMHRLLQFLPELPEEERASRAHIWLQHFADDMTQAMRNQMAEEVLAVLHHPDMAPVFAEGSQAEVPISGLITYKNKPRVVNGQVDRLRVEASDVWIIDYKTGRMPDETPATYIQQLEIYKQVLQTIYPDKNIHSALLWTESAKLILV